MAPFYEIRVKGRLDTRWESWFQGLSFRFEEENTVLRGPVADQACLHGILERIRDLNLTLLSVNERQGEGMTGTRGGNHGL
jgi:hypothetical protein